MASQKPKLFGSLRPCQCHVSYFLHATITAGLGTPRLSTQSQVCFAAPRWIVYASIPAEPDFNNPRSVDTVCNGNFHPLLIPMSRALRVDELLNPVCPPRPQPATTGTQVDIRPQLAELAAFSKAPGTSNAPKDIQDRLNEVLEYLGSEQHSHSLGLQNQAITTTVSEAPVKRHNVPINRITTLEILYEYPLDYVLEYPETSATGCIGHLFRMDPKDWQDPALNIAYSRGGRMGQTVSGASVQCRLLVNSEDGSLVPCSERHTTCEGSKICPNSNEDNLSTPHVKASREDVSERLQKDREDRLQYVSPSRDIFLKTSAYIAAVQKLGCARPLAESTNFSATEEEEREAQELYLFQTQRGYRMKEGLCEGRIVFDYGDDGRPYISCEHYNAQTSKDHLHDYSVGTGSYHLEYIDAVFSGDEREINQIEEAVLGFGYGPLADCSTVSNCSQQKAYCPFPHRDDSAHLVQPLMKRLPCESKFRVFEPKEEYREKCPFVLIVTSGSHPHPVPLPTKTPPKIRSKLMEILGTLAGDLPTEIYSPSNCSVISDLQTPSPHLSDSGRLACIVNLKAQQDERVSPKDRYIRRIIAIPVNTLPRHDEDEEEQAKDHMVRIILCMSPEASRRLLSIGRYLQSDIAFRRIVNFLEFELACMDRDANTTAAHQRVFEEIEAIVKEDTGKSLKWRHLHATSIDDSDGYSEMIISWTADQHRGQAQGKFCHVKLCTLTPRS
ncbi:hypothetical protein C8R43DRAFT_1157399 [Mycena crocata]|nr:hypothetical protein C8R43DRAFT_1157399 [Mycena crocata]